MILIRESNLHANDFAARIGVLGRTFYLFGIAFYVFGRTFNIFGMIFCHCRAEFVVTGSVMCMWNSQEIMGEEIFIALPCHTLDTGLFKL